MCAFRVLLLSSAMSVLLCFAPGNASAQVNSNAPTVLLNATLAETLVIAATPGTVNFTLVPGSTATASSAVVITTTWVLNSTRSTVAFYSWFTTPSAALTDGLATPNNIPSTAMFGQVTSGLPITFTAFTQTNTLGIAAGGLKLFTQPITSANRSSSRSDNLNLKIDLTSQPQLPAGSYTGTLNLQAQAL